MIYYIITADVSKTQLTLRATLKPSVRQYPCRLHRCDQGLQYNIEYSIVSVKTLNIIILLSFITIYA